MKKVRRIGLGIIIPLVLIGVSQCSQQGDLTGQNQIQEPVSLDAEALGGYDTADEAAAFGLPVMSQFTSDEPVNDPTVSSAEDTELTESGDYDVYMLRLVWGNLKLNIGAGDDDLAVVDWSGTIGLEGEGALILKRLILFERHDRIIDEDDRQLISWESYTGPHIDGVLIKVLVPATQTDGDLVIMTESFEQTLPISQLDKLSEISMIDEDGNGMAIAALKLDPDDCLKGFMQGKYHRHPLHPQGGVFYGRFISEHGRLRGLLRGHFGINPGEDPVLFGKYIDDLGHFRGRLKGQYGNGSYDGVWISASGLIDGTLGGKYVIGDAIDSGFFQGFWEEACE